MIWFSDFSYDVNWEMLCLGFIRNKISKVKKERYILFHLNTV